MVIRMYVLWQIVTIVARRLELGFLCHLERSLC